MKKTGETPKKKKSLPGSTKRASFPIAGIGASAGGLEAYQELLTNLSAEPGMAFVFIMHLAPEHKSILTDLLARSTGMPVIEIKNGMAIKINHVYVIPPGTNVSVVNCKLKLNKMKDAGARRMPIDWFFRSLAEKNGSRAIGVILSGTATDGTLGAEAIKAEGGIIFAQDEKTAKYTGMPQSAIVAGCVDFVLSPKKIASELEIIAKHPLISSAGLVEAEKMIITEDKGLEGIFDILRSAKRLDFTHYKLATISRRISRRMVLLKLKNLKEYIKFLNENKDEIENLYEDLLLKVTSFFRDPEVFQALRKLVIPEIIKNKAKGQDIRIWIPGCSSGEEAYSIAMCFMESLGKKNSSVPVRIFATDVSESNIDKARRGIYNQNIQNDLKPERLKKFFTKTGSSYKISKVLRDICIFSKQNVFSDPPFSNLDLVSCRNLLIYLQPVLQRRVFHNFHYALRSDGFLLLGSSESAGGYSNLFKMLEKKQRIYVKKYLPGEPRLELAQQYYLPKKEPLIKEKKSISKGKETDIESLVEQIVLSEYASCGALVDSDMEVVQFRGHTGSYLESPQGKPSHNLFKLVRKELFQPLHTAMYKAKGTKNTVKIEAENVKRNGRKMPVNITVIPAKSGPLKNEFFLVLFDEIPKPAKPKTSPKVPGKSIKDEKYFESLRKELSETKEYLQAVIEEQGNANEEAKTTNEELMSTNEELLSTNEELETAKEELQSSNEELITTNEELQNRNKEIFLLNNDLINLLSSTNMPVIMMGTDLVIRRITPQTEKTLNVINSDIGRHISKIKLNIDIPDFEEMLLGVIETLNSKTFEIKDKEGNWYSVYLRPYRTSDNKIDGVVAIFVDITDNKQAQQIIDDAREYAEKILETMREPLVVLDVNMKVISANRSFYHTFKVTPAETEGRFIYDLGNRQWDIPRLRTLLSEILSSNKAFDNYEIEHHFETIGTKTMLFNARRLANMEMILITIDDITERKQIEKKIEWLGSFPCLNPSPVLEIGRKGEIYFINSATRRIFPDIEKEKFKHPFLAGIKSYFDNPHGNDGEYFCREIKAGNGWYSQIIILPDLDRMRIYSLDITERKKIEEELAQSKEDEFKAVFENAVDGILIVDMQSKKFYMGNNSICRMLGYSQEEIKNLGVLDIHLEKDFPYVIDQFQKQAKGDLHISESLPVKRKDGSSFYADVNSATITIAGKVYLMGFFRDITKRKKAEDLRRESEDKYRSLFVSSRDSIVTLEPPLWKFTSGNPAAIKMFKVKNEAEFLTYDPWELSPHCQPDGRASDEKAKEMVDVAMSKGSNFFEWTHKRANGEEFLANVRLSRVEQGEKVFLHGIIRDITERKHLEEEVKNADDQKTSMEIKSRFTSMVSHELRSPLGAIKEGVNLVLEGLAGDINDEQKDLLDTAKRNVDRLGRLINNVLDFQKMAAGKLEFDITENDINCLVDEVSKSMCLLAKEKGLDLVVNADDSIPAIRFDKDRIVQVLTNLVSNAIKYTEEGNITISTKWQDNAVHVIVQDTGMGIKTEDLKKLFQVFEQLDSTRDKKKGGTGLGLAISSDIILAHKGKIWAQSEAGKGSAFHFTIPMNLNNKKKIGEILVEEKKITEHDLKKALEKQQKQ